MKISEVIDRKIVEAPFDDFDYDIQDKLIGLDGRPKVFQLEGGLKAVYHIQSNTFRHHGGVNAGQPITGKMLRNLWNTLGVGIGGTDIGLQKKQTRSMWDKGQAWFKGQGDSDTARATRLDPKASMLKKAVVGGFMKFFGPNKPPGFIPLSDETKKMLQGYVNKGKQKEMLKAFQTAVNIGDQVNVRGQIGKGGPRNKDADKEALAKVTAQYNELITKIPGMEELLGHLANSGEFVPALEWVKTAQPMTTNLLDPPSPRGLPKPQGKLPAPKKPLALPAPKGTRRNPKSGRFDPGNQSGVQFDSKAPE